MVLEVLTGVKSAAQAYAALLEAHPLRIGADYQDFTDAYARIGYFIEQVYRHQRIHSALG